MAARKDPEASSRARRAFKAGTVTPLLVAMVFGIAGCSRSDQTSGPVVGGDLHTLSWQRNILFVGGHQGAGRLERQSWRQVDSLDGIDAMGWGSASGTILVGGHAGLFASTDHGLRFKPAASNLPVSDVHGLGASGKIVYLASPQGGMFRSRDGGRTFGKVSDSGTSFMGNIEVDPKDPNHALAPDMAAGIAETTDGGRTWKSLPGPRGHMAVAWNPKNRDELVAIGMQQAYQSSDRGRKWRPLRVPAGTTAATYSLSGRLYVAALAGDRASVFTESANGWSPVP